MDTIAPYIAYVVTLGIAALIPGPGVAALVGQSLGGHMRASIWFVLGMALGDVVYLTVSVVGLAAIATTFASAFLVIKLLGGLYLAYLAYVFWTSEAGLTRVHASKGRNGPGAALAGFAITLGNPKTIMFYLALLPTVMDISQVDVTSWAILALLTILVLFATMTPYAVLATKARDFLTEARALRNLNRFAGAVIGGAGVMILSEAASQALRRS